MVTDQIYLDLLEDVKMVFMINVSELDISSYDRERALINELLVICDNLPRTMGSRSEKVNMKRSLNKRLIEIRESEEAMAATFTPMAWEKDGRYGFQDGQSETLVTDKPAFNKPEPTDKVRCGKNDDSTYWDNCRWTELEAIPRVYQTNNTKQWEPVPQQLQMDMSLIHHNDELSRNPIATPTNVVDRVENQGHENNSPGDQFALLNEARPIRLQLHPVYVGPRIIKGKSTYNLYLVILGVRTTIHHSKNLVLCPEEDETKASVDTLLIFQLLDEWPWGHFLKRGDVRIKRILEIFIVLAN